MSRIAFHLNCLAQGGAERVVSSLANQLCAMGEDVYIATEWQEENEFKREKTEYSCLKQKREGEIFMVGFRKKKDWHPFLVRGRHPRKTSSS